MARRMCPRNSSLTYPGGSMATLRIEFAADTITFRAKNEGDAEFTHLAGLDMSRPGWTTSPDALLIIGKGHQDDGSYSNGDYDNDFTVAGNTGHRLILDDAITKRISIRRFRVAVTPGRSIIRLI